MSRVAVFLIFICVLLFSCTQDSNTVSSSEENTEQTKTTKEVDPILENPDYSVWKLGKFYYRERPTGTFLVNRTDSIQEEFIKSNGMIVEFDIAWQNDSMYTLTYAKISENPYEGKLAEGIERLVKRCRITRVTDWYYVEEASSNLSDSIIYTRIYRYR